MVSNRPLCVIDQKRRDYETDYFTPRLLVFFFMFFDPSEPSGLLLWSPVFSSSVLAAVSGRSDCPLANER